MPKVPSMQVLDASHPNQVGVMAGGGISLGLPAIPGLTVWLDASKLGHANGTNVTNLPDYSGNGNHLTTSVGTHPFLMPAQNGLGGISFSGSNNVYLRRDTWTTGNIPSPVWTTFAVVVVDNVITAANRYFWDGNAAGNNLGAGLMLTSANFHVDETDSGDVVSQAAHIISIRGAHQSVNAWVDGVQVMSAQNMTVGGMNGMVLGEKFNATNGVNHTFLEGVWAKGDHSGIRRDIEAYFSNKWDIPVV